MAYLRGSGVCAAVKISLLAGLAGAGVTPALGQEVDSEEQLDYVTVTGSRLQRSTFETEVPLTVFDQEEIDIIGAGDIAEVVNAIPALRPTLTEASTSNRGDLSGGSYSDLRGLGYKRTLVLIDGRRYAPTNPDGAVSLTTIPQALIKGVEVVTGGASAAYGSDAVAGVVNFRIDSDFQGFKGDVMGGISKYNDYEQSRWELAYGTSFLDERLRLTMAADWQKNTGIKHIRDRPWIGNVRKINNPAYTATNDEPRQLLRNGVKYANVSYGGYVTTAGPFQGMQFAPDGNLIPFEYGELRSTTYMIGGDPYAVEATGLNTGSLPVDRRSLFGRLTLDATDSLTLFAEVNFAQSQTTYLSTRVNEAITVRVDNAFLPESVRSAMIDQGVEAISIRRGIDDNARVTTHRDIQTYRFATGANGNLGSGWDWDVYYSGGLTENFTGSANSRIRDRFTLAIDPVFDPATGAIVCRSTLTDPDNGCVPMNLLGQGNASEASLNWVNGNGWKQTDVEQHVVSAELRGEPFSTWAGVVKLAVGAEHRSTKYDLTADPLTATFGFRTGGAIPSDGKVHVNEGFGEVLVPLVQNASWAKYVDLSLAGRLTDYSTSGTVNTWKAGLNYAINDTIRLRATQSRDIRAPGLTELFSNGTTSTLSVNDLFLGTTYLVQAVNTGNPDLDPEVADTFTAGIVFTPSFAPRLNLALDYYDIRIKDAIVKLSTSAVVELCYTGAVPSACDLIFRPSPNDPIEELHNAPINYQLAATRGLDFAATYSFPFLAGRVSLNALVSYLDKAYLSEGIGDDRTLVELHDSMSDPVSSGLGGGPKWRYRTRVTYRAANDSSVSLIARYVGGGRTNIADTYELVDIIRGSGVHYLDLAAEIPLWKQGAQDGAGFRVYGNIRNVLDARPPLNDTGGGFGTARGLYDTVGRVYRLGVKFDF